MIKSRRLLVLVNAEQANTVKLRQLWHQDKHQRDQVNEKVSRIEFGVKSGDEKSAINGDITWKSSSKTDETYSMIGQTVKNLREGVSWTPSSICSQRVSSRNRPWSSVPSQGVPLM